MRLTYSSACLIYCLWDFKLWNETFCAQNQTFSNKINLLFFLGINYKYIFLKNTNLLIVGYQIYTHQIHKNYIFLYCQNLFLFMQNVETWCNSLLVIHVCESNMGSFKKIAFYRLGLSGNLFPPLKKKKKKSNISNQCSVLCMFTVNKNWLKEALVWMSKNFKKCEVLSLLTYFNVPTGGEGGENKQKAHTQNHNIKSPSVCHGVFLAVKTTYFSIIYFLCCRVI